MMRLKLTQGKVALLDDEDEGLVIPYRWCAIHNHGNWYGIANIPHPKYSGRSLSLQLHRLILGLGYTDPQKVDHRDGDGLNNQKSNLRVADSQQNSWNRRGNRNTTSIYKGVSWHQFKSGNGKWRGQLTIDGTKHRLGLFDVEEDAARACDKLMLEMHGEFARLNFPE